MALFVLFTIVGTLILVEARMTQTVDTTLTISYELNGVMANVETTYSIGLNSTKTPLNTDFSSTGSVSDYVQLSQNLSEKNECLTIEYKITNLGGDAFVCNLTVPTATNMYTRYLTSIDEHTDYHDIQDTSFDPQLLSSEVVGCETIYIYVQFGVQDLKNIASLKGNLILSLNPQL